MTDEKKPACPPAAPAQNKLAKVSEAKPVYAEVDFGKLYFTVQGNEILRPIKAIVELFEKLDHFYSLWAGKKDKPGSDDDASGDAPAEKYKYVLTSAGYTHLNKVAGISILTPQAVIVDGVQQPNPHIERNPRTKAIESVQVRKIGIGYSPAGQIVVVDKTLFYNTYTYFIQSIQAKMKREKWEYDKEQKRRVPKGQLYPDAAMVGIEDEKPTKAGRWAFFPTEPPLGIWANYDDKAILDCLEEHTQRQRFGDRIAQKIVERNIMKDHPAIGVATIQAKDKAGSSGKVAYVAVYGYRHAMAAPDLVEIMKAAERGVDTAPFDRKIEVKTETIHPDDVEEEAAEMRGEAAADTRGHSEDFSLTPEGEGGPEGEAQPDAKKAGAK